MITPFDPSASGRQLSRVHRRPTIHVAGLLVLAIASVGVAQEESSQGEVVTIAEATELERQGMLEIDGPLAVRVAMGSAPPEAWIRAIPGEAASDLRWPVEGGRLWRGFGMHARLARTKRGTLRRLRRRHRHEGVDIGAAPGTPILAANDGLVIYSDHGMRGYGNVVVLVHRDASITLYAHCSETYVAAGDLVTRAQRIAAVGATGLAHGPHLHFEWRVGGRTRDPLPHFAERPARAAREPSIERGVAADP